MQNGHLPVCSHNYSDTVFCTTFGPYTCKNCGENFCEVHIEQDEDMTFYCTECHQKEEGKLCQSA